MPPRREQAEIVALSADQARSLLSAVASDRLRVLYAVALALGLRQGEALGLRWKDVYLDPRQLTVRCRLQRRSRPDDAIQLGPKAGLVPTKTHRSRRAVALPPAIAAELREHRQRQVLGGLSKSGPGLASPGHL
jgi:integrase